MTSKRRQNTRKRTDGRRSISVKGLTHQRLKDHCDALGTSVSGYVEEIVAEKLDALGVPVPDAPAPRPAARPREVDERIRKLADEYFTF